MSRTSTFTGISLTPASASRRLASLRAPATSREKPGNSVSSASDIARLAPGRISPPTYLRKVVPCSFSAAPQRSTAIDKARRTPAAARHRQGPPHPRVVERFAVGVEHDHQIGQPRALRRGDLVAERLGQLVALLRGDATELGHEIGRASW